MGPVGPLTWVRLGSPLFGLLKPWGSVDLVSWVRLGFPLFGLLKPLGHVDLVLVSRSVLRCEVSCLSVHGTAVDWFLTGKEAAWDGVRIMGAAQHWGHRVFGPSNV